MDRGSCNGINYLEEKKKEYAVKYAERKAVNTRQVLSVCE
jgi:hypothetical protein